jgi:hypothetical protein
MDTLDQKLAVVAQRGHHHCDPSLEDKHRQGDGGRRRVLYLLQCLTPKRQIFALDAMQELQKQVPRLMHPQVVQHLKQVELSSLSDILLPVTIKLYYS